MRFYLDHDVPISVCRDVLTPNGHECWSANQAGMATEKDDNQTVYATDHDAVLVSCDVEFSRRKVRNSIGRHVWIKGTKPESAAILQEHLDEVIALLRKENVTVTVSINNVSADWSWK